MVARLVRLAIRLGATGVVWGAGGTAAAGAESRPRTATLVGFALGLGLGAGATSSSSSSSSSPHHPCSSSPSSSSPNVGGFCSGAVHISIAINLRCEIDEGDGDGGPRTRGLPPRNGWAAMSFARAADSACFANCTLLCAAARWKIK